MANCTATPPIPPSVKCRVSSAECPVPVECPSSDRPVCRRVSIECTSSVHRVTSSVRRVSVKCPSSDTRRHSTDCHSTTLDGHSTTLTGHSTDTRWTLDTRHSVATRQPLDNQVGTSPSKNIIFHWNIKGIVGVYNVGCTHFGLAHYYKYYMYEL